MTLRGLAPIGGGIRRRKPPVVGRFESPVTRATAGVREVSRPREKLPFREPLKTRGEILRIAELERLLDEPMSQQERLPLEQELIARRSIEPLFDEPVQREIRFPGITEAEESLRRLYPEIPELQLSDVADFAIQDPEAFVEDLIAQGRNPDIENILLVLGATPEDIDFIFQPPQVVVKEPVPEPLQAVEESIATLDERLGFNPAPPADSKEERQRRVNVFRNYRQRGGELTFSQWELMGMPFDINVQIPSMEERNAVYQEDAGYRLETFKALGEGLLQIPKQFAASILRAFQRGSSGASVVDRDWADRFIKKADADLEQFAIDMNEKYGEAIDKSALPFSINDIATLPKSLSFSLVSMGAGLGVGLPIAAIPFPGARVAAWVSGAAASGAVVFSMTTYEIMQQYLELKNEEQITETGAGLTQEQEDTLKADFESKAIQYGLWEAVPEAVSNLAFGKLLTTPLTGMVGRNIAVKIVTKLGLLYGEEFLTETITQKGQSAIEVEAGLREGNITWVEAFKEIAPQTFLLTTILGGVGQATVFSVAKIKNSLKKEVGIDDPLYDFINENIDTEIFEQLSQNEILDNTELKTELDPLQKIFEQTQEAVPVEPEVTLGDTQILVDELKRLERGEILTDIEMLRIRRISPEIEKGIRLAGRDSAEREAVLTALEDMMSKIDYDTYRDFFYKGTEEGRLVANEMARKELIKNGWLFEVETAEWFTPVNTRIKDDKVVTEEGSYEAMIDALRSDAEDLLDIAPEAVRPPTAPVEPAIPAEIPEVPVVEGVARKGTDVQEAIPPEIINEPTPVTVDDTLIVHDLNIIDRFRPTRFVFDKMGLFDIWQSAFEAETLKAEEQVAFSKELNKHAKAVGKDKVRRELMWEFVNNSNQEVFNQLTFEEKRAALWWKKTADNWADRLNIPQDQRIKDYIPHIFDEQAKQDKDLVLDASISMMFSDKIKDRVKMPFLEERLGAVNGLIKDPFLAAQAYQNVALKKFYYEPILQKLKVVSEHKDAQGNFTTPEFARNYLKDYSRRMTGEPSGIDKEINKTLTDMANKVRGLPGGEVLANFLDRGNPSGMAAYNLTSALYVMWLGFKPTTAIRNLSQHGLIIADVDSIQDFGNGIRLRFTKEGRAALEESLVWRSRRGAFIESIDSSMASKWSDSVRETALFMFRKADEQNVKDAFLSGYAEAKRLYPDADRSWWIKRGDEVASDTQYLYTKMNSLGISQSGPGKVVSMLTTWAINWLELMNKYVRGKQSRTYIDLVKQSEGKFALKEKNWLTSRKSLLVYLTIVGLAYAIKEQDWNKVKTFEYTGFTSINTFSNLIGGDFPALQLPGAVADLVTGTLLKDERKTKTALNELKRSFSILNQVERVASGERDWLSLLFYLEGKNYQVRQLKEDWEDNWKSYDDLTDPLVRAKQFPTLNENTARKRWREQNQKIEAQMFVTNRLGTLSSEEARQEVLRLINKHNIDTDVINGYEKIFGVDTTVELNKAQKRIGNLEKFEIGKDAKYFTTANFLTELNGTVKTQGRDKVERDGHAFAVFALGQQDSWQPYEDYDPKTGARLLYRQNNPDVEASLYLFGKISAFENPKSAEILLGWMDKYNIPPQAIFAFNENPDRYDELFTQKFELETKNFDLTTQYENYSNSEASNYIEDKEERKLAREKFKEDNPEWIADQRRIEAIDNDASSEIIEKWAERGKIIDEFGASSSESKVWLLDNPETNQWALDNELLADDGSDWNEDVLRLNSKWRKQDEEYAGFGDKDSRNYIKDEDARRETRESYLKSNPEYSDDIRRRQMHSFDAPDEIVEDYVSYGKVIDKFSSNSAEANLFRYNNPELSEFGEDKETLDWEPIDKSKVPIWQIDVQYAKEDAEYQAILDKYEGKEETEKTDAYLYPFGVPSPYALKRYERQALEADFPKEHIPTYIDWYTKTELNKPDNWSEVSGTDLWYEDDWFLIANQEFYQTMIDKGIFTERRDYRQVPTREVFDKYLEYLKEPEGKSRKDFRWELWVSGDKTMENWLIDKGYTPIVEQAEADVERKLKTIGRDESKFEILKALSGILGEEAVAFLSPMSVQEILDGLPKSARERLVKRFAEKLTPSEKFKLEVWKREQAIAPTLREIERKLAELLTKQ